MVRRPNPFQVCNVIGLAGLIYGIMTMLFVLSFVLSEMGPRTSAKAVTILKFVTGSLLLADSSLSVKAAIDRTWLTTGDCIMARTLGVGKTVAGAMAIGLLFAGLRL